MKRRGVCVRRVPLILVTDRARTLLVSTADEYFRDDPEWEDDAEREEEKLLEETGLDRGTEPPLTADELRTRRQERAERRGAVVRDLLAFQPLVEWTPHELSMGTLERMERRLAQILTTEAPGDLPADLRERLTPLQEKIDRLLAERRGGIGPPLPAALAASIRRAERKAALTQLLEDLRRPIVYRAGLLGLHTVSGSGSEWPTQADAQRARATFDLSFSQDVQRIPLSVSPHAYHAQVRAAAAAARQRAAQGAPPARSRWQEPRWTRVAWAAKALVVCLPLLGAVLAVCWALGGRPLGLLAGGLGGLALIALLTNAVNPWLKTCPRCGKSFYGSWTYHVCD